LGDSIADICLSACTVAKKLGLTVSCDINYRKNLWDRKKAGSVMERLMEHVDICIANEEDAADVFGIHAPGADVTGGVVNGESYKFVASELTRRFGFSNTAITLRESISANDNIWSAMLYDGDEYYFSNKYPVHIVDRIGGGDSFSAAMIYCMLMKKDPQSTIDFAAAASCLKHSIEGDMNMVSIDEVESLVSGNGSGRVQR
jgi:2-dehydro-3-deoxygluconokinase